MSDCVTKCDREFPCQNMSWNIDSGGHCQWFHVLRCNILWSRLMFFFQPIFTKYSKVMFDELELLLSSCNLTTDPHNIQTYYILQMLLSTVSFLLLIHHSINDHPRSQHHQQYSPYHHKHLNQHAFRNPRHYSSRYQSSHHQNRRIQQQPTYNLDKYQRTPILIRPGHHTLRSRPAPSSHSHHYNRATRKIQQTPLKTGTLKSGLVSSKSKISHKKLRKDNLAQESFPKETRVKVAQSKSSERATGYHVSPQESVKIINNRVKPVVPVHRSYNSAPAPRFIIQQAGEIVKVQIICN